LLCQCSALHVVSDHFVFATRAAVSAAALTV
jgi:hypothetical protein